MKNLKRSDWVIGAWYYNPMMERCGSVGARYTKLYSADPIYDEASSICFDEAIMPNGDHLTSKDFISTDYLGSTYMGQSNPKYEEQMVLISNFKVENITLKLKYGL